jgi:hypothetical protein
LVVLVIVSWLYGAVAMTLLVQLSSKKTEWKNISANSALAEWDALTLADMSDVPRLLSNGAILIGGIVGKDNRVDMYGSTLI